MARDGNAEGVRFKSKARKVQGAVYCRQAIVTRFLGPTNYRSARVSARAQAGRIVVSWDDAFDVDGNHGKAAEALANKFGWLDDGSRLVGGALPDGRGNCYVVILGDAE